MAGKFEVYTATNAADAPVVDQTARASPPLTPHRLRAGPRHRWPGVLDDLD